MLAHREIRAVRETKPFPRHTLKVADFKGMAATVSTTPQARPCLREIFHGSLLSNRCGWPLARKGWLETGTHRGLFISKHKGDKC
jgi:hypothetical protein